MPERTVSTGTDPIRLQFNDNTRVLVTPEDEDRFITTSAEAAAACQQAQNVLKWKREFDGFLRHIHDWCDKQVINISKAYMAFSHDGLKVFILTQDPEYRFDFDDSVSDLDVELDRRFPRCPAEVMQLPETPVESLTSFFDPGKALQIYGE